MRQMSLHKLGLAALAGATIAGCNLLIYNVEYRSSDGGIGGDTTSSSSSSGSSGTAGSAGGDAGPAVPGVLWAKTFSNGSDVRVNAVTTDDEGNVYLAGSTIGDIVLGECGKLTSATGVNNGFVVKLAADGSCQWKAHIASFSDTTATALVINGNDVVIGGQYAGEVTLPGEFPVAVTSGNDAFVASYPRVMGNATWVRYFSGSGDQAVSALARGADGKVYVAVNFTGNTDVGTAQLANQGGIDLGLLSLDPMADAGAAYSLPAGKMGDDVISSLVLDPAGEKALAVGWTTGTVNWGSDLSSAGAGDVMILGAQIVSAPGPKINTTSGWLVGDGEEQQGRTACFGSDGEIYVGGVTAVPVEVDAGPGSIDGAFLLYYDTEVLRSALTLGASYPIEAAADAGADAGTPIGPGRRALAIARSANSVVVAAALSGNVQLPNKPLNVPGRGLVVASLEADLSDTRWAHVFGAGGDHSPEGVAVDGQGNILVAGYYNGTLDFGSKGLKAAVGTNDIFVVKLGVAQ